MPNLQRGMLHDTQNSCIVMRPIDGNQPGLALGAAIDLISSLILHRDCELELFLNWKTKKTNPFALQFF